MSDKRKEQLIIEWKQIRGKFFNHLREDREKFEKSFKHHPLYKSIVANLDKNFKEVNHVAELEIDSYLNIRNSSTKNTFK